MKGLFDALRQLAGTVEAIATSVESPVSDTVGDAQDLAEALKRLPGPAADIDLNYTEQCKMKNHSRHWKHSRGIRPRGWTPGAELPNRFLILKRWRTALAS